MTKQEQLVKEFLGHAGLMITASKGRYNNRYPLNFTIFNSNVVTDKGVKIWHGDLDLTLDLQKLKDLSNALKIKLHVLREMDGRFDNEKEPKVDRALVSIDGDKVSVSESYSELTEIDGNSIRIKDTSKYKREDYTKELKLPELTKFASKSAKQSPMEKLVLWIAEEMGGTPKGHLPAPYAVYLSQEDFAVIEYLTKNWIRKFYTGDDEYETQKSYAYYNLDVGVSEFREETPRWAKPGHAYMKPDFFVKVDKQ